MAAGAAQQSGSRGLPNMAVPALLKHSAHPLRRAESPSECTKSWSKHMNTCVVITATWESVCLCQVYDENARKPKDTVHLVEEQTVLAEGHWELLFCSSLAR